MKTHKKSQKKLLYSDKLGVLKLAIQKGVDGGKAEQFDAIKHLNILKARKLRPNEQATNQ